MEAASRLSRSSHSAFIHDGALCVWGGYQMEDNAEVLLPSAELWTCDLESRTWQRREMGGDVPPELLGSCTSYLHQTLYVFGGTNISQYTNQMFSVDLAVPNYSWRKLRDIKGNPPSPRDRHTCWVHRDRIIYFGGYGCKTMQDVQNTPSANFLVEEMSWATIGNTLFRFWGWNNEVHVFDTRSATWSHPHAQGSLPLPRDHHASALQGNKGYISGGLEATELDIFCLDLDTWTWTCCPASRSRPPLGRSMFTMTALSNGSLFIFGGLGADGETLKDAWRFDPQGAQWTEVQHPHSDKPRMCHSACLGRDDDVLVFGGNSNMTVVADMVTVLRVPSPLHCHDVLLFQTQPYSLHRLCEDLISRCPHFFAPQLSWLPSKLRRKLQRRSSSSAAF